MIHSAANCLVKERCSNHNSVENIEMVIFCFFLALVTHSYGLEPTYASVTVNSTWESFCKEQAAFKSSLANYVSYKTQVVTRPYQVLFLNADSSCQNAALRHLTVELRVSITYPTPNSANQDLNLLAQMVKLLENGATVGGIKVISAKLVTDNGSNKVSIGSKTILIIIGIVLGIYLLGYFCVISTQSDSYTHAPSSSVYMVSTVNKEYDDFKSAGFVKTIGDKQL